MVIKINIYKNSKDTLTFKNKTVQSILKGIFTNTFKVEGVRVMGRSYPFRVFQPIIVVDLQHTIEENTSPR